MDRRNNHKSTEERLMEQVLSGFQRLLLSSPAESSNQQHPEDNSEVSEYDLIDPEVAAAELNHVLGHLPWRQHPPNNESRPFIWNYFNLTMQIMEDLHNEHSQKKTDPRRKCNRPPTKMRSHRNQLSSSSSDIRPTSLDYLFKCSKCCDMFSMLYENFGSDSSSRGSRETLFTHTTQHLNEPSSSHIWMNTDHRRSSYVDKSQNYFQPQRPSLSPVPNLPSTSRQYLFGFSEQPSCTESRVSTSPVPNLPSTSRSYIFVGSDQTSSSPIESNHNLTQKRNVHQPRSSSLGPHIDIERKKKFLRIKKEKSLYQRRIKK